MQDPFTRPYPIPNAGYRITDIVQWKLDLRFLQKPVPSPSRERVRERVMRAKNNQYSTSTIQVSEGHCLEH
jgi:hypothetical protein